MADPSTAHAEIPSHSAAVDALCAQISATSLASEYELLRLADATISACERGLADARRDNIITAAHWLLTTRPLVGDELLLTLLRLLRVLYLQVRLSDTVAANVDTVLTALAHDVLFANREDGESIAVIACNLAACIRDDRQRMSVSPGEPLALGDSYLTLCIEQLSSSSSSSQQQLTLNQLLAFPRSLREQLVVDYNGAALLAQLVTRSNDHVVASLAQTVVRDIAQHSTAGTDCMLQWWLDQQAADASVSPVSTDLFVQALGGSYQRFPGEWTLHKLTQWTSMSTAKIVWTLASQPAVVVYLSRYHRLAHVVATVLIGLHTRQHKRSRTKTSSTDDSGLASMGSPESQQMLADEITQLWAMLLRSLRVQPPVDPTTTQTVVMTHAVAHLAAIVLASDDDNDALHYASALDALQLALAQSYTEERKYVAGRIDLARLVQMLAAQQSESSVGRQFIALLRAVAGIPDLAFAHEIEQVISSLCTATDSALPSSLPMRYQNLLLVYCDIPGVALGQLHGLDQAIAVRAVLELLGQTTPSALVRLLSLSFLHCELALDTRDPVHYVDADAVTRAIAARLRVVIAIALDGSTAEQRLTRRIVTAVARSDRASLEVVRLYLPLAPTLVMREVAELAMQLDAATCDAASDGDEYEYSDNDDDDDGIVDPSNADVNDKEEDAAASTKPDDDDADWTLVDEMRM